MKNQLICLLLLFVMRPIFGQEVLQLKNSFDSTINYKNRRLKGWLSNNRAEVKREFKFDSVTVSDFVNLYNVEFKNKTNISNSGFHSNYLFYHGIALPENGDGILFDSSVVFDSNTFLKTSDFRKGTYLRRAKFVNNTFKGLVDFTYSNFIDTASFTGTDFGDSAHFVMVNFGRYVDFSNCHFGRAAYFSDLTLADGTNFNLSGAILPDTLDFSNNAYIPKAVDFTEASFADGDAPHLIFLDRTDISMLNLDYIHFRLLFRDPKSKTSAEIGSDRKESIYEGLLKNFKDRGQWESYTILNKEYDDFKESQMSFFDKAWYIYASKPLNVLTITIAMILLLSVINIFFYRDLNNKVYALKYFGPEISDPVKPRSLSSVRREFTQSIIYTAIVFFTFSLKVDELHFQYKKLLAWFFTNYILGLITLFFLTHLLFK